MKKWFDTGFGKFIIGIFTMIAGTAIIILISGSSKELAQENEIMDLKRTVEKQENIISAIASYNESVKVWIEVMTTDIKEIKQTLRDIKNRR